jgi:hypothetical protein
MQTGRVATEYRVAGVAETVLIGADGKIFRSHAGMMDEDALRYGLGDVGRSRVVERPSMGAR